MFNMLSIALFIQTILLINAQIPPETTPISQYLNVEVKAHCGEATIANLAFETRKCYSIRDIPGSGEGILDPSIVSLKIECNPTRFVIIGFSDEECQTEAVDSERIYKFCQDNIQAECGYSVAPGYDLIK